MSTNAKGSAVNPNTVACISIHLPGTFSHFAVLQPGTQMDFIGIMSLIYT